MLIYKDAHVTKWSICIMASMGNLCKEGFLIPVYVMFFCETSSYDILNRKRDLRIRYGEDALAQRFSNNSFCFSLASIEKRAESLKRIPWYRLFTRIFRWFTLLKDR